MNPSAESVIELGHDVTFHSSFAAGGGIACLVQWGAVTLAQATLDPGHRTETVNLDNGLVRAHGEIAVDYFAGQVLWTVVIKVADNAHTPPTWDTILDLTDAVVISFDPCAGMVRASATAPPPVLVGPWGPSGPSGRGVTRIHVADHTRLLTDVGQLVKHELFDDYSPFTFNVVACCGRPTGAADGPGVYGDPESAWFNIFFGIYQLDCAKADGWDRPFGYESAAGVASTPREEDLIRLGKADWNWFSNYLYGVPADVCRQYSAIDPDIALSPVTTTTLGATAWHQSTMSGVVVASSYASDAPGARQLELNSILTPTVRKNFGLPCPRAAYPTSFIPTTLMASQIMAYWQDEAAFHTLVFGGTSRVEADTSFLTAQTQAAEAVIAASYPDAGFSLTG